MYEYFVQLLQERGVTTAEVSRATGISEAHFSTWKKRRGILGAEYLLALARYFDVPMEYFLGGEKSEWDKEEKKIVQGEDYYSDSEARDYAQFLFKNPEYRVLFDASKNVKGEDIKKAVTALGLFKKDEENN